MLLIASISALLLMPVLKYEASVKAGGLQQSASKKAPRSPEIAKIESYCKGIDQYAKSSPALMRYFVNSAPGEAAAAPGAGGGERWYIVKSAEEMSDAERAYATESISVLMRSGEIVYASIGEPMEHSRHDNNYYFRSDGTLAKISAGYWSNMEEIHLLRESFYDSSGKLLQATSQCFQIIHNPNGTNREKSVSCGRNDMRREIKDNNIAVYKRNSDLPGYALLKKS